LNKENFIEITKAHLKEQRLNLAVIRKKWHYSLLGLCNITIKIAANTSIANHPLLSTPFRLDSLQQNSQNFPTKNITQLLSTKIYSNCYNINESRPLVFLAS